MDKKTIFQYIMLLQKKIYMVKVSVHFSPSCEANGLLEDPLLQKVPAEPHPQ